MCRGAYPVRHHELGDQPHHAALSACRSAWGINGYFQTHGLGAGQPPVVELVGPPRARHVYGLYTFAAGMASVLSFVTSLIVVGYFALDWRWIFRIPVILLLFGGVAF